MELLVVRTVTTSEPKGSSMGLHPDHHTPCTHQQTYMSGAGTMCANCGTVLMANALKLEQTYLQNQHYFSQYRRITRSKISKQVGNPVANMRRDDVLTRILLEKLGPDRQPPLAVLQAVRRMFDAITRDEQLHRFLCSDTMSMTNGSRGKALVMVILLRVVRGLKQQKLWLTEAALVQAFCLPKKFATKALNIVAAWDRKVHLLE